MGCRLRQDLRGRRKKSGGFFGSVREDGSLEVELQAILGATNELGFNRVGGRTL